MKKTSFLLVFLLLTFVSCEDFLTAMSEDPPSYWITDIDNEVIKMEYLGFTDYFDGGNTAVGYDIKNYRSKNISRIRTKTYTKNRYPESFPHWEYTFTNYVTILAGTTKYDVYAYALD